MFKTQWSKKKQNNLIVLGVLAATLLAVFLAGGEWRGWAKRMVGRLWGSATIRWEKRPNEKRTTDYADLKNQISELTKDLQGTYGVYVEDLGTGANFGINEDRVFPAASLIKLPVFVAVYQEVEEGNISLDTKYKIQDTDKVSGAGSMYYQPAGTVYTYEEMLALMGKQSDNTAFGVFVKLLGEEKIQAVIDELGMRQTSFAQNETTPEEIGVFFRKMYGKDRGKWGKMGEEILEHLTDTIWEERIPAGIPDEVQVAHKVGTEIGVISDAGIVFGKRPFVLVILSEGVKESEAKEVLPQVAALIYADLSAD